MKVAEEAKDADTETLELKMAEQILAERPAIEAYIWVVKLIAAVAPLLGLFGTIIGMINTFQAITLFGTGDPKTMASGISEALVTTWLGLMCAIPSVLWQLSLLIIQKVFCLSSKNKVLEWWLQDLKEKPSV